MRFLIALFIISSLYYLCATLFLYSGLKRISLLPVKAHPQSLTFSVIIAAHNEETNIGPCLESVLAQTIDHDRFEVIVVNDRSTDRTAAIAQQLARTHAELTVCSITKTPAGWSPKKYAVSRGIACSRNEIIVFTDADCLVPALWLETIDGFFDANVGLVQGITTYCSVNGLNKIFFGMQALDFLSHGVVAAAAIGARFPLNSNANNMAFRKKAFDDVGGYGDVGGVVSGDDDLLVQRIWKSGAWHIRYMADAKGSVQTYPALTVSALFEQRKRWGSKTVHYNRMQTFFLAGIFCFYCSCTVGIVGALFVPKLWLAAAGMIMVK